jgi:p-aminobenzoyl-glutamate transporter AbgT
MHVGVDPALTRRSKRAQDFVNNLLEQDYSYVPLLFAFWQAIQEIVS